MPVQSEAFTSAPEPHLTPCPGESAGARAWLLGGHAMLDDAGRILLANEALAQWLGATPETLAGRRVVEAVAVRMPGCQERLERLLASPRPFDHARLGAENAPPGSALLVEKATHGATHFLHLNTLCSHESFSADWPPAVCQQVLLRLRVAETRLQHLEQRWPGVIFTQRPDFSFAAASRHIEDFTGLTAEDWINRGEPFLAVVHEADEAEVRQHLQQAQDAPHGLQQTFRVRHHRTGRIVHVWEQRQPVRTVGGLLLGYEGIWLDVTRQALAEKRLSSLSWKETLSVLTTGLAHDFNNILAGIFSLSESYEAQVGPGHPFHEGVALIKSNTTQAIQLLQRIRSLHHWKIGGRNYHDFNFEVNEVTDLVRKIAPKRIRLEAEIAAGQLPVYVDAVALRQVVINLALNAFDAMPNGGKLRLRTSRQAAFPPQTHLRGAVARLPCVCFEIQDDGHGIPARHLDSIFDAFFTTKPMNKGSGLGLYNARLFVEEHGGAISVESAEQAGTTFRLWLPEANFTEAEQMDTRRPPRRHTLLLAGGAGSLLYRTAVFLRQCDFYVVVATTLGEIQELLHSPDFEFSGLMLLVEGAQDRGLLEAITLVEKAKLPLKKIVQVIGCSPDELDAPGLNHLDLIIPPDMAEPEILSRLKDALEDGGAA
ncbi:MAG: PAS domain S-box protein [Verrucomicrobia bacterium]|nr:PAS domain S-box protein [Verrucomicrobiota bacterium]